MKCPKCGAEMKSEATDHWSCENGHPPVKLDLTCHEFTVDDLREMERAFENIERDSRTKWWTPEDERRFNLENGIDPDEVEAEKRARVEAFDRWIDEKRARHAREVAIAGEDEDAED